MLDSFPGGWQTIFPNGGDSAVVDGAEWGVDGEARVAWFDWEQAGSSVILTSRLLRSPFTVTKIISVNADEVTIGETVKNVGERPRRRDVGFAGDLRRPRCWARTRPSTPSATLVRPDPRQTADAGYDDILPWPRSYGPDGMINLRSLPAVGPASHPLGVPVGFPSTPRRYADGHRDQRPAPAPGRAELGRRRLAAPVVPAGDRRPSRAIRGTGPATSCP